MELNERQIDATFLGTPKGNESRSDAVRREIEAWIKSAPLIELVELFGDQLDPRKPLDDLLSFLESFSDQWDFRRRARERNLPADDNLAQGVGAARWLTKPTDLTPDVQEDVLRLARDLGLVRALDPRRSGYDYCLVLGGARLSCKLRPLRAAEVIRAGVRIDKIALLGAARPVADTEREATDTYAPNAVDEFDLAIKGGQAAFGFNDSEYAEERHDDSSNSNLNSITRRFKATLDHRPLEIMAVSAPSSDPTARRANSADTLKFFFDSEKLSPRSAVLLITSQIYVPYVQLEALRTIGLPREIEVETIGFPGDRMPELQGMVGPNNYLQEIRSAIQAARRFCLAYPIGQ